MSDVIQLQIAVTADEVDAFEKTAQELGLKKETAIEIFMRRFIASGGFPFAMRSAHTTGGYDALFDETLADEVRRQVEALDPERGQTLDDFDTWLKDEGLLA